MEITETFEIDWIDWSLEDVNSHDVSVLELVGLGLEQNFCAMEALGTNSDDKSYLCQKLRCCQRIVFSTSMRTKLMMLKLHVEEAKMPGSDTAVSMSATWSHPYTPAGRNRGDSDANCTSHLQWSCFALAVPSARR